MTGSCRVCIWIVALTLAASASATAQGRGGAGGVWATPGSDAQRTSSIRADPKISPQSMGKEGFQFLWKRKLGDENASMHLLTQPVVLPNIIAYKGFKALVFVGDSADHVYAIDYELNRMFWSQHLATAAASGTSTAACPGGLWTVTKAGPANPAVAGGRAGGAPVAASASPERPAMPGGRDGNDNVFAISSGGMVHLMNPQVGTDQIPPVKFLPANAKVVGSAVVDRVLYAATTGNCGGAANGVWAVDVVSPEKSVTTFDTKGAPVAGAVAPTFGTDGTVYVATGAGGSALANAVIALQPKTLEQKDWFTAATAFTSAPVAFQYKGKDLVVAANKDGRLYLLDSAAVGGADHKTPLYKTAAFGAKAADKAGLATWADSAGTRWVIATTTGAVPSDLKIGTSNGTVTSGAIVAFTLTDTDGALALQPQWVSQDIQTPLTPAVINGVVFAVSGADAASTSQSAPGGRGARATPAVLYALDGATGRQLWTSGTAITSPVRSAGPSGGDSQVYVVAEDGTLYAFGMPAER
jgi:hypothetical protein